MKLTFIIPVFNEEKTLGTVLRSVDVMQLPLRTQKEVIIINDGSTDSSLTIMKKFAAPKKSFRVISLKQNHGKGFAIRKGLEKATGDYLVVQDADLEYSPQDLVPMVEQAIEHPQTIVYGERTKRILQGTTREQLLFILHYLGNLALTFLTWILYGQHVVDGATCYKMFPRSAIESLHLTANGFDFDTELTAKLLKKKYRFISVPISFTPRGYKEGKKLHAIKEGPRAFAMLFTIRFSSET